MGAGGTVNLPTPDATGTIAMSGTSGKVALVTNGTLLTCGTTTNDCLSNAAIKDFVGYGTANNYEGTGATAPLSNTTAAIRNGNGCTETDNNAADFTTTAAPNPRNSTVVANQCGSGGGATNPTGTGSANPNPVQAGAQTLLTVTVTPGANPTSSGINVSGNLTAIGGAASQQFYDDGTNGDATAGDNIFSFLATVANNTTGGTKNLSITITDAQSRTGSTSISVTVNAPTNPSGTGAASPASLLPGAQTLLTVTVTAGTLPTSTGLSVTANLSAIGGSSAQQFFDDGTNGDATAGDNVFSFLATVAADTAAGTKTIPATITDAQSRTGATNIFLTVQSTNPTPSDNEHLVMGNPSGATTDVGNLNNYLLLKPQYVIGYNCGKSNPNWVSWHLDQMWLGSASRQDDYRADTTLPAGCYQVQGGDYSGSGFDRGHMTPSGDRTRTVADNSATFLMTNFIPQAPDNNQGPWERLETESRNIAKAGNELYIVTGGAGTGGVGSNGAANTVAGGRVNVPAQTWKVILVLPVGDNDVARVNNQTRAFGVIMPNTQGIRSDDWRKYIVTVDQVEQLTGYDFYSNVDDAVEAVIESRLDSASTASTIVQFNQSTYSVAENAQTGIVTLTVTRSGATTGASSVEYTTNDTAGLFNCNPTVDTNHQGVATSRCDYSTAVGTLSFAAGETTKTFMIPIIDDVHVEGTETFTVTLRNPTGATLGTQGTSTVQITDNETTTGQTNPIDSLPYFVRQHYLDFFGRNPDQTEVQGWVNATQTDCGVDYQSPPNPECYDKLWVSGKGFFASQEFQQKGYFLYRFYKVLGRTTLPTYNQFVPDLVSIAGTSDADKDKFAQNFVRRAQFLAVYPDSLTNDQFVDKLVQQTGLTTLNTAQMKADLNSLAKTKAQVVRQVAESAELYQREYNEGYVVLSYFGYLRRDGDFTNEYSLWINRLNENPSNYRQLVDGFIRSIEYRQRFGQP